MLQATCHKIFSLWIVGQTTITSGILERSKKFAFSIYLMSYSHRLYGLWNNATDGNFVLRKKQYNYNDLSIARHLVGNKITNQTALLNGIRSKPQMLKDAILKMEEYTKQTVTAGELQTLLGIEGVASRLYFSHWFAGMAWNGRKPRTKMNILNTTMDIGYTYLFNIVESMLNLYGFDLYQGKFGGRLQYSVFEIKNSERVLENITTHITHHYEKRFSQNDSVMIFNLSKQCKITRFGYAKNDETDLVIV